MEINEICSDPRPYNDTQDAQVILWPWVEQSGKDEIMLAAN
jgi:hypothetical protein